MTNTENILIYIIEKSYYLNFIGKSCDKSNIVKDFLKLYSNKWQKKEWHSHLHDLGGSIHIKIKIFYSNNVLYK